MNVVTVGKKTVSVLSAVYVDDATTCFFMTSNNKIGTELFSSVELEVGH